MDEDSFRVVSALFAAAAARLEAAHEIAIQGQSLEQRGDVIAGYAEGICRAAKDATALGNAAAILMRTDADG